MGFARARRPTAIYCVLFQREAQMLTCPVCQARYEDDKKFCKRCGAALIGSRSRSYCRDCGIEYEADKKFCKKCGRPLASTSSADSGTAGGNEANLRPNKTGDEAMPQNLPRPALASSPRFEDAEIRNRSRRKGAPAPSGRERPEKPLRLPAIILSALLLIACAFVFLKCIGILIVHGPLHFRHADVPLSWLLALVAVGLAAAAIFVLRRLGTPRR
jgi:hypothetical protein